MSILLSRGDFSEGFAKLTKTPKEGTTLSTKEPPKEPPSGDFENATDRMSYIFEAKSFPANGVHHSFEITHHQTRRWRDAPVLTELPTLMAACTVFYLITLLYSYTGEEKIKIVKILVLDMVLVVLPFTKSLKYRYISEFATAIVTMICVLQMEMLLGRRQCLVTFLSFLVVGRVLYYKSFFDNFAICVAYSVNSAALNANASLWYYASNISLVTHFIVALLLLYVYKRLWHRIWEHIRILMILTEKQKQEDSIGKLLVSAHIPVDIQNHIFPPGGVSRPDAAGRTGRSFLKTQPNTNTKPEMKTPLQEKQEFILPDLNINPVLSPTVANKPLKKEVITPEDRNAALFVAAGEEGLLPPFTEAQLSLEQLYSIGGLDRRECALVAISFDSADVETGAQDNPENLSFLNLLDKIAVQHRITCVRHFGNVWIGCVGYFQTWEAQYINCYEAVLFATEASFLSNSGRVSFAVDCGAITGGYQNSLNFDLFGQEIRWLLMVIELKLHGKVVVGDAVQRLLNAHRRNFPDLLTFRLASKNLNLPWRTGSEITVNYIENGSEIVDFDELKRFVVSGRNATLNRTAPAELNWTMLQNLLMQADMRVAGAERRTDDAHYTATSTSNSIRDNKRSSTGVWEISDSKPGLDQEIGEEFLLTATQRFQLSFDDPVLDKYTDEQLYQTHVRLEKSLFRVIREVCFPNLLQRWCLYSNYSDTKGQGEYKSVMSDMQLFTFDWYPSPLIAGAEFFPIWRLFLPPNTTNNTHPESEGNVLEMPSQSPRVEKPAPKKIKKATIVKVQRKYQHPGAILPIVEEDPNEVQEEEEEVEERGAEAEEGGGDGGEGDNDGDGGEGGNSSSSSGAHIEIERNFESHSSSHSSSVSGRLRMKPALSALSSKKNTNTRQETKRSWQKYVGDVNLFFHNSTLNSFTVVFFYVAMLFAVHFLMIVKQQRQNSSIFLCVATIHFLLIAFVERRYDNYVSLVVFALNILGLFVIANSFVCFTFQFNENSTTLPVFGDFNGEMLISMFVLMLVPFHMRQHTALSFMDSIIMLIFASLVRYTSTLQCYKPVRYRGIVACIFVMMNVYYYGLQYSAYASYFLEHKLLPSAMKNFQRQRANTRALLHAFAPSAPVSKSCELYVRKPFAQCAVTALHIKAADQITHFVEPYDLAVILNRIHKIVEKCITECGMLSVTRFSGVYIAVACKDGAWDSVEALRFHENHTARTVVLLRNVRNKLAQLSNELHFNVQMGIGIHQGPVLLGFVGRSRFSFDVCGPVRDLAVAMASFHTDGAFANEAFDSDIRKMQAPEDLIRDVTSILDPKRTAGTRWLRIDGSFNGIQLEDFKYLCLLGQGGYGSVHLVAEKHTGAPYAIKAIDLKQESKMTKMIERECSILQMVDHPNVVNLKYSFRNHNRLYLVMSYIRGGNLKQVVERDKLDLPHMVLWFAELVLAVDYLHSLGIIHRDVKPANCMIGTDGHLKLADFGLSKVVTITDATSPRGGDSTSDELGISLMSYQKVMKFLPLKNETPQEDNNAEMVTHRTIKILLITMDDAKADSTLLFINTTVEVVIADYDIDSDTIRQSGFEAIFIDGDYYEEDSIQLVSHFSSQLFNKLPVVLFAKDDELRRAGLSSGALACSRLPLESLIEETFDVLFGSDFTLDAFQSTFQKYLSDLILYQEDRAAKNDPDSLHLSLNGKGFDKETSNKKEGEASSLHSKSRNFVAVESKSHSLVGTLHFIAPEVIRLRKYGKAVDWWACGITFYECLVRKHLFAGDDKRVVFESIMNAPIVLDALQPFGEPITALVRGLLNRDIRRRLGSQSIGAIKSQKVFEKIDWGSIHQMNPLHKPAQFVNRKFRADDRDLFFGPTTDHDISLRPENLEMRNTTSMQKYLLSKKRAKMRGGNSSSRSGKTSGKIGRLSTHPGGTNTADTGRRRRGSGGTGASGSASGERGDGRGGSMRKDSSRSISNSLDYQDEMIPEQQDEEEQGGGGGGAGHQHEG